jgi:hypothetical protein
MWCLVLFVLSAVDAQANPAGIAPMGPCLLGRMTNTATSDLWQGKCKGHARLSFQTPTISFVSGNFGPTPSPLVPVWGGVYGTNQNNCSWESYGGFRESVACGECFQVNGPGGSVRLMVIAGGGNDMASFGPDDNNLPHFEVTTDVYNVVSGGVAGLGWLTITLRKVACDFSGTTIKMMVLSGSDLTNVMMSFQFHVVGMQGTLLVQETGSATWSAVMKDSFNRYNFRPSSAAAFPLKVQIFSVNNEIVQFQIPSGNVIGRAVTDTGGQFATPGPGYGGASTNCPNGCALTMPNNGLTKILDQGVLFPENVGIWKTPVSMGSTNQQWMNFGTAPMVSTNQPFTGSASGKITAAAFSTMFNLGCNIKSPIGQVTSVSFQVRADANTAQDVTVNLNDGAGGFTTTIAVTTSWSLHTFPIAGNAAMTSGLFSHIFIQNGRTVTNFYFDQFQFAFTVDPCYPTSTGPLGFTPVNPTVGTGGTSAPTSVAAPTSTTAVRTISRAPLPTTSSVTNTVAPTTSTVAATTTAAGLTTTSGPTSTRTTSAASPTTSGLTTTITGPKTTTGRGTTTSSAPTTAGPTTTVAGTTSSGVTVTAPPTFPQTVNCPSTCCLLSTPPEPVGWARATLTLSTQFSQFVCTNFQATLASEMGASQVALFTCISGSTVIDFAAFPPASMDTLAARVSAGTSTLPATSLARVGFPTATPPSSFPWAIVVGVVVGLLVVALVVVVVICCWRRRSQKRDFKQELGTIAYVPLTESSAPRSSNGLIAMCLVRDVIDTGEGILDVRKGDIAFLTKEDAGLTSEWAWVKVGTREGYVPRSSLVQVKG